MKTLPKKDHTDDSSRQSISVHCVNYTIFLSPPDISCLEGEGNYTYIYTHSGKKYLVPKTIKNLQSHLHDCEEFLRVHKSYVINTKHIVDYINHDRSIKMAGGKEVFISRRKSKEITQILSTLIAIPRPFNTSSYT
jgi:two-component system LytT family response regulator